MKCCLFLLLSVAWGEERPGREALRPGAEVRVDPPRRRRGKEREGEKREREERGRKSKTKGSGGDFSYEDEDAADEDSGELPPPPPLTDGEAARTFFSSDASLFRGERHACPERSRGPTEHLFRGDHPEVRRTE